MLVARNIRSVGFPWSDPVAFNRWRRVLGRVVTTADRVLRRTVDCGAHLDLSTELVLKVFQEISTIDDDVALIDSSDRCLGGRGRGLRVTVPE